MKPSAVAVSGVGAEAYPRHPKLLEVQHVLLGRLARAGADLDARGNREQRGGTGAGGRQQRRSPNGHLGELSSAHIRLSARTFLRVLSVIS